MYKRNFLVMAKLHVVLRKFENSEIKFLGMKCNDID